LLATLAFGRPQKTDKIKEALIGTDAFKPPPVGRKLTLLVIAFAINSGWVGPTNN
jgi:hypothetical protein